MDANRHTLPVTAEPHACPVLVSMIERATDSFMARLQPAHRGRRDPQAVPVQEPTGGDAPGWQDTR